MAVPRPGRLTVVIAVSLVTLFSGCRSWLFYPDQTPSVTLARKLGSPELATDWTLRQTDADEVWKGVLAIRSFASADAHPKGLPAKTVVPSILDGLARVATKLNADWPVNRENVPGLTPQRLYRYAAEIAATVDEPSESYRRIEPTGESQFLHASWQAAGIEIGVLE